jgi:hypothetical protein
VFFSVDVPICLVLLVLNYRIFVFDNNAIGFCSSFGFADVFLLSGQLQGFSFGSCFVFYTLFNSFVLYYLPFFYSRGGWAAINIPKISTMDKNALFFIVTKFYMLCFYSVTACLRVYPTQNIEKMNEV